MTNTSDYNEFLNNLKDIANENIDKILESMDCEFNGLNTNDIRSCCPIHDGDNDTAFSYNTDIKSWRCYTHNCHNKYISNVFGLIQGYLERLNKPSSFKDTVKWIADVLSLDINILSAGSVVDKQYIEVKKLLKQSKNKSRLLNDKNDKSLKINIEDVRKHFVRSEYYKNLGLSDELIDKYLLNDCLDKTKPMYNRACVPVIDESGKNIIGVTGRIMVKKCEYCDQFHEDFIGCNERKTLLPKWKHFGS